MLLTLAMAGGLLWQRPSVLHEGWMHAKLAFVAVLVGYHLYCAKLRKQLAQDECKWGPKQLRALNEGPTLLLVTIVMLVIFQKQLPDKCHNLADCRTGAIFCNYHSAVCSQTQVG